MVSCRLATKPSSEVDYELHEEEGQYVIYAVVGKAYQLVSMHMDYGDAMDQLEDL